ncbi:MAG: glutamate 5-kinase [Deltaproteobacteria bacterium]|nr:glutamate 5-kinase [Deltaproteobacteria bacterium]
MKQRIIVKIGSSSLTSASGGLDTKKLAGQVRALSLLNQQGYEVVLVTSGAIASGFKELGFKQRPRTIEDKQAAAAVGQCLLMQAYSHEFSKFRIKIAQVLLTRGDFLRRDSYNNALNTLSTLIEHGVVPIINENDTVATGEIRFGDNDVLAALVACLLQAGTLIMVTDIDGFYEGDPRKHKSAKRINQIDRITPAIIEKARSTGSSVGTGGMYTKIKAAEQAMTNGVRVFIGRGGDGFPYEEILAGSGQGTYFGGSASERLQRKKQWIAFHAELKGSIAIDSGAVNALVEGGRSLLPVGVKTVQGKFNQGDVIAVNSLDGKIVGKGIVNYSSRKLKACLGKPLKSLTPGNGSKKPEVIHRDDWVELYVEDAVS